MENIEITLTKDEYITLLKFLSFSDFCASQNLLSNFQNWRNKEEVTKVINKIYRLWDKFDLPKHISFSSLSDEIRFWEEDFNILDEANNMTFQNIAHAYLWYEFAKVSVDKRLWINKQKFLKPYDDEFWLNDRSIMNKNDYEFIVKSKYPKFLNEFKNNWISNLRFKLFYQVKDNELE